jgi:limonene-1,2-epoxide hydrolase
MALLKRVTPERCPAEVLIQSIAAKGYRGFAERLELQEGFKSAG